MSATDAARLDAFQAARGQLFGLAYRMLGSATEAEDIVQEAWLRWQVVEPGEARSPRAYLTTVVTRLCLDQLKSARQRREQYTGPWVPEPLAGADTRGASPEAAVDALESISLAFVLVLERLAPVERAVFLLHDVFDYGYGEIADITGRNEAACRQVLHRARERVRQGRPRFPSTEEERQRLTLGFLQAVGNGDVEELATMLTEDCVVLSDGGGRVHAAMRPVLGRDRVARLVIGLARKQPWLVPSLATVNGWPGLVLRDGDRVTDVLELDIEGGRIRGMYIVRNPEKLGQFA